MKLGKKELGWTIAGLAVILIGGIWFALSLAGVFTGMNQMYGYFLAPALVLSGLIIAGVYFYRYQRIQNLLQGKGVLVQWKNADSLAIIAATCAFVDGELYLWSAPGTRLEDVQIERRDYLGSERSTLQITFGEAASKARDITGRPIWRTRHLSIRIPEGQDLAAQTVLEQLKSRL